MFIKLTKFTLAALLWLAPTLSFAKPFHHQFEELREYHRHWLAVCPDRYDPNSNSEYYRNCWASTFTGDENGSFKGDFPGFRLSVSRNRANGNKAITFVAPLLNFIDTNQPFILIYSNGDVEWLRYGDGITTNGNSDNEFLFANPASSARNLSKMLAGNYVTIRVPLKAGPKDLFFSTIGLRAALKFTRDFANHSR